MRRLGAVVCSVAVSSLLTLGVSGHAAAAARSGSAPAVPTGVVARAGLASITVSWHSPHKRGETFTVTSLPTGKGCTVVGVATCTISVTDSTPWRFEVRASVGSSVSAASDLTSVVAHRVLVVLAGQSNATGAQSYAVDPTTGVDYLAPPYANGADMTSTVSWMPWGVLRVKGHGRTGQSALDTPQIFMSSASQIFGPEVGWARQIYADTGDPVSIVKAAYPNTSLAADWLPSVPNGLFSQMVTRVTSTMSADAQRGQLDTIGAVAWYQGEADASDPTMAADYRSNLTALIAGLRSDLPADQATPIVLVKESMASVLATWQSLGSCGTTVDCAAVAVGDADVRTADDWAEANFAHVLEVDTLGLPRYEGLIHLTNVAELTIGEKIAATSDLQMP